MIVYIISVLMQLIDSEYIHLETEPNGVVFFSTMTALFHMC